MTVEYASRVLVGLIDQKGHSYEQVRVLRVMIALLADRACFGPLTKAVRRINKEDGRYQRKPKAWNDPTNPDYGEKEQP